MCWVLDDEAVFVEQCTSSYDAVVSKIEDCFFFNGPTLANWSTFCIGYVTLVTGIDALNSHFQRSKRQALWRANP